MPSIYFDTDGGALVAKLRLSYRISPKLCFAESPMNSKCLKTVGSAEAELRGYGFPSWSLGTRILHPKNQSRWHWVLANERRAASTAASENALLHGGQLQANAIARFKFADVSYHGFLALPTKSDANLSTYGYIGHVVQKNRDAVRGFVQ